LSAKHTPGPWRVEVCSNGILSVQHPAGYVVDDIDCGSDDPCSIHDAHLIAAAPDLYSAVQKLLDVEGIVDPTTDECIAIEEAKAEARAAIKKARGEK
jgi:hypothetical protein